MPHRYLALLAILAGCNQASGSNDPTETGRVRYHMRQHFNDLRTIERMLVAGKLEEAKTLAFMLTQPVNVVPDNADSREVSLAVGGLINARTIDEALYAEARTASACAQCHVKAQKLPVFRTPSQAPADLPTITAQMARHQWAVDRIWEGIVGASDEHWRAGLYVLATSALPQTTPKGPELATRLQQLARAALDSKTTALAERAEAYGEMLVTCAGCHSAKVTVPKPKRR